MVAASSIFCFASDHNIMMITTSHVSKLLIVINVFYMHVIVGPSEAQLSYSPVFLGF